MLKIVQEVGSSVSALATQSGFKEWLSSQGATPGDLIVVNNSFVLRQAVTTNKSDYYLVLEVGDEGQVLPVPSVATKLNLNSDFQLLKKKSKNLPIRTALPDAMEQEIKDLGRLVFILVGHVEDDVVLSIPLNLSLFSQIILDPNSPNRATIQDTRIVVRDTFDEEKIWEELLAKIGPDLGEDELASVRRAVGISLDQLQAETYARLVLPGAEAHVSPPVIDSICEVLKGQRNDYVQALKKCDGDPAIDNSAYNEVLRISYNFATDAAGLIRLIVSICDLKPVVLWGTIGEHYRLSEAFKSLPWLRSRNKPSLPNYAHTIGDARNSAFHHLFPFRKTLEVSLGDEALQNVALRIFSEHTRKKENRLLYQDKALVDVLVEFTRAGERRVAPRFWRQNVDVMDATLAVFQRTGQVLRLLHAEKKASEEAAA
jgi:hypothetical protein